MQCIIRYYFDNTERNLNLPRKLVVWIVVCSMTADDSRPYTTDTLDLVHFLKPNPDNSYIINH